MNKTEKHKWGIVHYSMVGIHRIKVQHKSKQVIVKMWRQRAIIVPSFILPLIQRNLKFNIFTDIFTLTQYTSESKTLLQKSMDLFRYVNPFPSLMLWWYFGRFEITNEQRIKYIQGRKRCIHCTYGIWRIREPESNIIAQPAQSHQPHIQMVVNYT